MPKKMATKFYYKCDFWDLKALRMKNLENNAKKMRFGKKIFF